MKSEQGGLKRRKHAEKARKRKSKGNLKRKSKVLQKVYYKKKSNQAKYQGTVWIDPKPKDFTLIKERVTKNPSRKKLKTQKSRTSYFRASSNKSHKSYGGQTILKRNEKLDHKYASRANILSKGKSKVKLPKVSHRKTSRQNQKHSGNIFLQPEAKKKDFNEIKSRVEKRPGRSMAKRLNEQKGTATANASLTQTYRGEINTKGRVAQKLSSRRGSKASNPSTGPKRRTIKTAENQRKYNSASAARFSGGMVSPARNQKRLRHSYMSKTSQKHKGTFKRPAKSPGPQFMAKWNGNLNSESGKGKKTWAKYGAKKQTKFTGDQNKKKSLRISNASFTKNSGNLKARSLKSAERKRKYSSASAARFNGELVLPGRNYKRLRHESISRASQKHKGDFRRPSKVPGPQFTAKWSGEDISKRKKGQKQLRKFETKKQTQFTGALNKKTNRPFTGGNPKITQNVGGIKVYSQNRQNNYMKRDSKITGSYSGRINSKPKSSRYQKLESKSLNQTQHQGSVKTKKKIYRGQEIEGKSLNLTTHKGGIDVISKKRQDKFMQRDSKITGNYSGVIRRKSANYRAKERQQYSLNLTQHRGALKTKKKQYRAQELEGKSLNHSQYAGNSKTLSKKKQDKYMSRDSKITGNYSGNLLTKYVKSSTQDRRNKSLINSQYSGNLKMKKEKDWEQEFRSNAVNMSGYSGELVVHIRDRKRLEYKYRSRTQHGYKGEIKQKKYIRQTNDSKVNSNAMANFTGNLKANQDFLKEQQYAYMSNNAHNFRGHRWLKKPYARDNYFRNISDRNRQIIGNYRVKTGLAKDIEQQIISAKVHNYQGGPKVGLFTRIWLSLFDNTGKLDKIDDKTKKPDYDSREYKIWN